MSESPIREAIAETFDQWIDEPFTSWADLVVERLKDPALAPHLLALMGYEQVAEQCCCEFHAFKGQPCDWVDLFARVPRTEREQG